MQLILSIDDIGIKKNMSSGEETNEIEKKIKTDIIDSKLASSPSPPSFTEEDPVKRNDIVESSQDNTTDELNGVASCDEASIDDENLSKIGDSSVLENHRNFIPDNGEETVDVNTKPKTETGDALPVNGSDEFQKQKSSHDICDKNINSDINLSVMTEELNVMECQDENISNKNENKDDTKNEELNEKENESKHEELNGKKCDDENVSNIIENEHESNSEELNEKECHDENVSNMSENENESKSEELNKGVSGQESQEKNYSNIIENEDISKTKYHDKNILNEIKNDNESKCEELYKKECHDENDLNINDKDESKSKYLNEKQSEDENVLNVNESKDDKIKKELCENEKIYDKLEAGNRKTIVKELSQNTHSDENDKDQHLTEENGISDNASSSDENNLVKGKQIDDADTDVMEDLISENIENFQPCTEKTIEDNTTTCSVTDEVIDIADERDSSDSTENEGKECNVENKPTEMIEEDKNLNVDDVKNKKERPFTIDEDIIDIADEKDSCDSIPDKTHQEFNILRNKLESKKSTECLDSKLKKSESTDKVTCYKLSNTLDILSDEEEESNITKPDSPKPKQQSETNDKQCINVEEDDDIMVIDDESSLKDEKIATEDKKTDEELAIPEKDSETYTKEKSQECVVNDLEESRKKNETNTECISNSEIAKTSFPRTPLLSSTTLKSFKKNLAEMTREELEDFCILTIAEAVFDRSNLGELKSQMKILTQHVEEHKLKAKNLAKQNRDLQVVLKSIQEEQKKNSDAPITPLKITRSVGMQVLMTDKVSRKRQAMLSGQTLPNSSPTKQTAPTAGKNQNKQATITNNSNTKSPRQGQQQIPVPRLVPAVSPVTKPSPNASPLVNNVKSPVNVPNGVKAAPSVAKPEKRTHTKMQQNSAVTVDLTDDEPPAKVVTRNFNSPVRCVPPQSLLAPRPSLPMTSPRKVYIPISGQQAQNIRPGQHIMLKSVTGAPGTPGRPRGPSNMKIAPNTPGQIRARIGHRHPAPLPELMKQYQPPNWKALPPAPELKLAKVENGIVISWKIDGYREENHEEIASYQLFAYQETSQPPNTSLWKKIGDVKALPLPMACTLTQFMSGYKYYFAVRAVDVKSRFGPFSLPGSILLLKN